MNRPPDSGSWRQRAAAGSTERAGWRKADKNRPDGAEQHWRRTKDRTITPTAVKRIKLLALTTGLLAMLAIFVAWLLFRPRPVPLLALMVVDYNAPLDPNAYAVEDVRRFEQVFQNYRNVRFYNKIEGRDGDWKTLLDRQLEKHRTGGPGNGRLFPDNDVLILFVSAHGVVDRQGRPALLMSGSKPLDDTTWVTVLDLIAHINRHQNVQQSRVVLILDAGRIRENWSSGILYNGFADALLKTLTEAHLPRLYVINSTRHNERGFAAPELGGSVFAYFVAAGLRGAADTNADGQVRLRELTDYLQNHVASWVSHYRSAQQQPLIVPGDAEDFGLAYVTGYERPETADIALDSQEQETADQLWQRYVRLEQAGMYGQAPLECAEIQSNLTRLEKMLLAGAAYGEQLRATMQAVTKSLSEAESDPALQRLNLTGSSLALLQGLSRLPKTDVQTAADSFAQWMQLRADPKGDKEQKRAPVRYEAAAAAVWQASCAKLAEPHGQIAAGLEFLETSSDHPPLPCKEIALLKMLHEHLDWDAAAASFVPRALAAQDAAERVTVPEDVRAHYWISSLADKAEQQIRLARDELFVGSDAELSLAEQQWSTAVGQGDGGQYAEIQHASQAISHAYAIRDKACALAPYLAQWLLSYPDLSDRPSRVNNLLDMIRRNRELSATLEWRVHGAVVVADSEAIAQQSGEIEQRLGDLLGIYQQVSGDLSVAKAGSVGATLNKIMITLDVPLATEQRIDLRHVLFANLLAKGEVQDRGASAPDAPDVDDTQYLAWLTNLPVHPALALLDRTGLDPGDEQVSAVKQFPTIDVGAWPPEQERWLRLKRLAEIGGEIRDRLSEIEPVQKQLAASTEQALAGTSDEPPVQVRQGYTKADQLVRCAAGLLGRRPWLSRLDDPSHKLWQLDLHFLLLWHGRRIVDDFWGPPETGAPAFFADSARQHLVAARQLCREARSYQERFSQDITQYEAAAANWSPITAGDVDVVEGQRLVRQEIEWHPNAVLPEGQAAVFLRWAGGGLAPIADLATQAPLRRRAVEIDGGTTARPLRHLIRNDGAEQLSGMMEVVVFYRGYERTAGFYVGQKSPGATVTYRMPEMGPPRIRVKGDTTQKTQIIFVLDCSSSMKEEMEVENQQKLTRLQIARSRLLEVLDSLDADYYQVGLVLYGHRAGWKTIGPDRYEMVWRSDEDRQRKLHPAEDVELAVPVRPMKFTDLSGEVRDVRQVIATKLSDLRPYGETPLYFALIEALQSFNRELPGPRHVVVITDGVNEQTSEGAPTDVMKHRDDVQQALKNPPTRAQVDIIGFGLKNRFSNKEEEQLWLRGQADLKAIARDPLSNGDFHEARDPSSLMQKLRDSLRLVKFYVYRSDGPLPNPTEFLDLNQTWTVQNVVSGAEYAIQLAGLESEVVEKAPLEGGESLLLVFNRGAHRLEHLRFEDELRASQADVRDPQQPDRRFFVGAHLPQRQSGAEVWFRLSVQNATAYRFSPRPRQIWAEIRPLPARDRVFYVSDAEFEPDQPVPVLRLRVSPWPLEVQRAEVRLWFTMSEESGAHSFDLDLGRPTPIDLPNVNVQIDPQPGDEGDPYRVVALEQHTNSSTMYPLRLQVRPSPDYITHSYFENIGKVRHVFAFNDRTLWNREKPKLLVTPIREKGVLDNWVSTGPIEVDLTRR
ncbi:MAG: hypothetical protein ACYC4N_27735 [Pirellulaceae bacterium]